MSSPVYFVTTTDNPFNYFTHFDEWKTWDEDHGYHTLALLGRTALVPDDLPQLLVDQAIDEAIDVIVLENLSGMHTRVAKPEDVSVEG